MNLQNIILETTKSIIQGDRRSSLGHYHRGYIAALVKDMKLADTVTVNAYGTSTWFYVYNREDLQTLMTLAPFWSKSSEGQNIVYTAEFPEDCEVRIYATDDALPATCRLVEEEVVIPPVPEKVIKRMRVECAQSPAATDVPPSDATPSTEEAFPTT